MKNAPEESMVTLATTVPDASFTVMIPPAPLMTSFPLYAVEKHGELPFVTVMAVLLSPSMSVTGIAFTPFA